MISFLLALLFVLLALLTLTLEKTYFYVPKKELKRQAALQDELAAILYRATAYDRELKLLLWTVTGLSAAAGIVLFARVAPPVIGFAAVVLILWLGFIWLPRTRLSLTGARLAQWCTPAVVEVLRYTHPLLRRIEPQVNRQHAGAHTGLYEREDLDELLERQSRQSDNRITDNELGRMRKLLIFGNLRVADILIPRKSVVAVNMDDAISPVLLDDLHKSGHPRFPVYESEPGNVIGTLALDIIADTRHRGSIRDYFDPHLAFVHEADSLEQALRAFYETRQHLFIVINSADEYVGIVTLSDILKYLMGAIENERFGHYDDRKAVIERHRKRQQKAVKAKGPAPAAGDAAAAEKPDSQP